MGGTSHSSSGPSQKLTGPTNLIYFIIFSLLLREFICSPLRTWQGPSGALLTRCSRMRLLQPLSASTAPCAPQAPQRQGACCQDHGACDRQEHADKVSPTTTPAPHRPQGLQGSRWPIGRGADSQPPSCWVGPDQTTNLQGLCLHLNRGLEGHSAAHSPPCLPGSAL